MNDTEWLKEAYERFHDMYGTLTQDEMIALEQIAVALTSWLVWHSPKDRGLVYPNRVAAMLAIEAMQRWEKAEWDKE